MVFVLFSLSIVGFCVHQACLLLACRETAAVFACKIFRLKCGSSQDMPCIVTWARDVGKQKNPFYDRSNVQYLPCDHFISVQIAFTICLHIKPGSGTFSLIQVSSDRWGLTPLCVTYFLFCVDTGMCL